MPMLLDSSILIYYLNGLDAPGFRLAVGSAVKAGAAISIITRIEILGWRGYAGNPQGIGYSEQLIEHLNEIPLTEAIAKRCIELRRNTSLKLPDALIAATALETRFPLMTRNVADFRNIPGLILQNPFIP